MTLPEEHFKETERLISLVGDKLIADWLIKQGYYAEQYVLPPCFKVETFKLKRTPYFKVKTKGTRVEYNVSTADLMNVSFPKSQLTERTFGIIHPKIYHDIVWHLKNEWQTILDHIFHKDINIFCYSFPIPITSKNETELGDLRAGRMIYEFIEMAENDLVAEAHKFKYIVKTDIKNFYPSIYTHSISWALHGKKDGRKDRSTYALLGSKLDKLFQSANDGCTNGLPIGPAVSDLVSDLILAAVDRETSKELKKRSIKFIGVRFKDDYRFLCNSKTEAETIIKTLQVQLRQFNLNLNEGKSDIKELPEGLFRPWTSDYHKFSLRYKRKIGYKKFENTLLAVLQIDKAHGDTGVIDKFLSELTTKKYSLKLVLKDKDVLKTFSLLLLLKQRRAKAFPQILAIIELIFEQFKADKDMIDKMTASIKDIFISKLDNETENQYDLIWLAYFIKSNGLFTFTWPRKINSDLLKAMKANNQTFFPDPEFDLYSTIKKPSKNIPLIKHLAIFPNDKP